MHNFAVDNDSADENYENKIVPNEENARTTTEEDITLLSRPIYNSNRGTPTQDFDAKETLKLQYTPIDTSSSQFKKTTGNTDESRERLFEDKVDNIMNRVKFKQKFLNFYQYYQSVIFQQYNKNQRKFILTMQFRLHLIKYRLHDFISSSNIDRYQNNIFENQSNFWLTHISFKTLS